MNTMSLYRFLLSMLVCLAPFGASQLRAQTAIYNYACDFEDPTENAQWNLLVGDQAASIPNKWVINTAANNGGSHALYVSPDGGQTASYTGSPCVILASRTIFLGRTGVDYTLSFDWLANGYRDGGIDRLYVAWVPLEDYYGDPVNIASVPNSVLGSELRSYCLELNPIGVTEDERLSLRNKSTWQSCQTTISAGRTGKAYRLVFIWVNGTVVGDPGACIDNISILDGRACAAPTDLRITTSGTDTLRLTWEGDANQYEVGCYSYEKDTWQIYATGDNDFIFTNVPEGFCDFYVRTICWDTINQMEYYSGKIMDNRFIYYPDNHCIDYITMSDDNCYISTIKTNYVTDDYGYRREMVDNGSEDITSRHTHHYSKTETDPRTRGKLKTVPEGEIASVRLGNWDSGGESERVEFKFTVDSTMPILILKYAVVLESPGHDASKSPTDNNLQDPRFTLDILGISASDARCASADFTSSWVSDGWTRDTLDAITSGSRNMNVVWKDWTTVGVNLSDYMGETLTVQLTTYDCSMSAHFGYAYFTLGCDKAELDGESCDGSTMTEFRAPSGFDYKWYLATDPEKTLLSTAQTYVLTDSMDTREYAVDVIFKEDPSCYFTLRASSKPHYPVADFDYEIRQRDCRNYIYFTNYSRMEQVERYTNGRPNDTISLEADAIVWDLGEYNYLMRNPEQYRLGELEFPQQGDTFQVSVRAIVNNCDSICTKTIYLPAVGTDREERDVTACYGYPYTFLGTNPDGTEFIGGTYYESGTYNDTLISSVGCDSIITTHLFMTDTLFSVLDTIILSDDALLFNDTLRNQTGTYVHATKSVLGCDSIATLHLYVHEALVVEMAEQDNVCADAPTWTVPFTVRRGRTNAYSIRWESDTFDDVDALPIPDVAALEVDLPTTIFPDRYAATIIFHDSLHTYYPATIADDTLHLTLQVLYPDTVLTQRWNDLLAVRNHEYNGGFDFIDYRWYKNGQPLEGEHNSYLYIPDGLDFTAEYSVLLTRPGDSLALASCAFTPQPVSATDVPDIPTLVAKSQPIRIASAADRTVDATAYWITPAGAIIRRQQVEDGVGLTAPDQAGFYLLVLLDTAENTRSIHSVVVH